MQNVDAQSFSIPQMLAMFQHAGTQLIFDMDRSRAIAYIEQIRTVYGSGDYFNRTFMGNITVLLISRRLPHITTLLQNDPTLDVTINNEGHTVLTLKRT